MTELANPTKIIEPFSLEEIGAESFLIHKVNANIFHLNASSKLYVECLWQGIAKDQIITAVADRFEMKREDVGADFDKFLASLTATTPASALSLHQSLRLLEPANFVCCSTAVCTDAIVYAAAGILFRIVSEDPHCLILIDARLQLMRVEAEKTDDLCEIQVLAGESGFAVCVNGAIQVAVEDSNWLDVLVMQAMLDQITMRSTQTVILHAAAVTNDSGEAIIFAAPSGGGKSTLATFLALKGYTYLGDDIVLLNPAKREMIAFPTAPNLKPGSWPLFDEALPKLKNQTVFRPNIRPVKFAGLTTEPLRRASYHVKALIFPEFFSTALATLDALSLADSLAYLSEIRRNTEQDDLATIARQVIEFTQDTPCFSLQYGNLDDLRPLLSRLHPH